MLKITEISETQHSRREFSYRAKPKTRIYVWPKGESLIENLENRHSRPFNVFRKEVIPTVLQQLGLSPTTKVKWSQYAGCGCPCSPGFILDHSLGKDIHVTVTE